jgi:nitrite reductase/ring-hydroxylating ferredoxin subunit
MQQTETFAPVVAVSELREGFVTTYEIEGRTLAVTTTADGINVFDAICPHADFLFSAARLKRGCELECQMHGARFRADASGAVTKGPAKEPLWRLESRVVDGVLEVLVDW